MPATPVNLLALGKTEFQGFLDSFDHVFSDCDGVIWTKSPLPGSGDFFKLMKKHGKTVHFVSNNSIRTKEEYEGKFQAAGIDNGFEKLTLPSIAILEYLKEVKFNKSVYCITCPETRKMLEKNGISCKGGPDNLQNQKYEDFHNYLIDDKEIGAVVFDSDYNVNLAKLYKAQAYLSRPDVLFVSGATDKIVPIAPGVTSIGAGAFTELVTQQVKRNPIQIGKPGRLFGEFAMKKAGVNEPSRVLFIGDMIEQDVGLGKATGFKTLLLLTNTTEEQMMNHTIKPDFYAPSLGSLVPQL